LYSLSPQRYDSQPAAIAAGCFRHTADASSLVADVWRKQTRGPSGPTAVGHSFARTPREGTEIATASGRRNLAPLLPVGWKSLIQSKLRLVDHANSTGLFLVTLLLSVTSILCSGQVLLSDLFFNKTTSSSDSSWSCLGHLTGESTLFI
jgi:hypothetical protein